MTLNLAETSVVKSRPSVPYGANFFCNINAERVTGASIAYVKFSFCGITEYALKIEMERSFQIVTVK